MAKAISLFDNMDASHVPDYIRNQKSNIAPKTTVPTLSYEGKVWSISIGGEKTQLMKKDADGDDVPLSIFRGVILDYAKHRGRAYYEGDYDPANQSMPLCWSDDGVHPAENVPDPQSDRCANCPMAAKGSGKSADKTKKVAACSQHLMIVVVPATKLDFTPLRMKLAITSVYDKESPEMAAAGWRAFDQYIDTFRAHKVPSTAVVVTKMRFDPNVTYPKVMFSSEKWLPQEDIDYLQPIIESDAVKALLTNRFVPAESGALALPGAAKQKALPAPKPKLEDDEDDKPVRKAKAPVIEDEEEEEAPKPKKAKAVVIEEEEEEAPAPKAKKKAVVIEEDEEEAPKPKAKKKAVVVDEDEEEAPKPKKAARKVVEEEEEEEAPEPPAKKKAPSAASAAAKGGKDIDSILTDWAPATDAPKKKKKVVEEEEEEVGEDE